MNPNLKADIGSGQLVGTLQQPGVFNAAQTILVGQLLP
jgi:hypothetical protein